MEKKKLKFARKPGMEFHRELRDRVNAWFKEKGFSRTAPARVWFKVAFMALLYFLPFVLALTLFKESPMAFLCMFALMGLGMAGIGMNIVHDANHGSLSRKGWVNELLGSFQYLVGVDKEIWKQEHNVEHHTFTNIDGHDSDIAVPGLLRISPNKPLKPVHRFQFLYAWLLYCMVSLRWAISGDFVRTHKNFLAGKFTSKGAYRSKMLRLLGWKLFYHAYTWVLPAFFLPVSFGLVLGGFLLMHAISSLIIGVIFQMAHIMPDASFPEPDEAGAMPEQWAVHQMLTTCNFGTRNPLLSWCVGGLNFQIEHHLFPTISHLHYPELSLIVEETAQKYGVPYHNYSGLIPAVFAHGKHLYQQGRPERKIKPHLLPKAA